jgi:Outer membrane protein beta-barrel domain
MLNRSRRRMNKKTYLLLLLGVLLWSSSFSQVKVENLPKYDRKLFHFGFTVGFNQMDFAIKRVQNPHYADTLLTLFTQPEGGFQIGIVSNMRIHDNFDLRFIPTLSFGDRVLNYSLKTQDTTILSQSKRIESTFIDFPVYVKFKSNRLTNFRAYVLAGGKYSLDLASQKDKEDYNEYIVKLKRHDFSGEVGVGFDFYLEYFKFAVELKMSYGLTDLLYRENNVYTNSIERLNSKMFWLSFTFE